jgi:hypothetical protein
VSPEPEPRFARLELPACLLLLVGRVLLRPPSTLWRDWVLLLGLLWLASLFPSRAKNLPLLAGALAAYLLAIYGVGQWPYLQAILRGTP